MEDVTLITCIRTIAYQELSLAVRYQENISDHAHQPSFPCGNLYFHPRWSTQVPPYTYMILLVNLFSSKAEKIAINFIVSTTSCLHIYDLSNQGYSTRFSLWIKAESSAVLFRVNYINSQRLLSSREKITSRQFSLK